MQFSERDFSKEVIFKKSHQIQMKNKLCAQITETSYLYLRTSCFGKKGRVIMVIMVHSTYANILKNRYKKVRKNVGIG